MCVSKITYKSVEVYTSATVYGIAVQLLLVLQKCVHETEKN